MRHEKVTTQQCWYRTENTQSVGTYWHSAAAWDTPILMILKYNSKLFNVAKPFFENRIKLLVSMLSIDALFAPEEPILKKQ